MQFSIDREVILRALSRVQGIVEKRNTIPILSNVLIEALDEKIRLTATDLEVGMQSSYPAKVSSQGKITVAAKKLFEIIKELPDGEVAFQAKENCWIEIRCGKALFNLVGLAADEFPQFPTLEGGQHFNLSSQDAKTLVDMTAFSMSHDESKFNLNGIFFQHLSEDNRQILRLVATDGHRLAMIQRAEENLATEVLKTGVILPRKGVQELKKIAEDGPEDLSLGFSETNAMVTKQDTVVVMRLVDGEFPDYRRVIPQMAEISAVIPRDQFLHALRRMAVFSSEKSRGVKLTFRAGVLEISSSNPDLGDAREELEIDYAGQELAVGFNSRYLLDILQSMVVDEIKFHVKDNMSPGLVTRVDDKDFLSVVMPMRL
ncbi:MAG: DNA polymerase III subunit beta [Desulfuromonas sp.]|nr:MAG: DNA polymerase III subunit beta [Desulfuromonas sp.]